MLTFAAMNGIALGLLIPLMGTVVGSGFVFLMRKEMPQRLQKWLLGFASGVMVAASVWSTSTWAMTILKVPVRDFRARRCSRWPLHFITCPKVWPWA